MLEENKKQKRQKAISRMNPFVGEPSEEELIENSLSEILNHYALSPSVTPEKCRKWFEEYLIKLNFKQSEIFKVLPDTSFITIGTYCRVSSRGIAGLDDKIKSLTNILFNDSVKITNELFKEKDTKEYIKNIKEERRLSIFISLIESTIDKFISSKKYKFEDFNYSDFIKNHSLLTKDVELLREKYVNIYNEINKALSGDLYYKEAYSNFSIQRLKILEEFLSKIVNFDVSTVKRTTIKKPRKQRKKKIKEPKDLVKKLKFLNNWESFKSIDPKSIIGSSNLYLFNPKYRRLEYYSGNEFSISGSKLINWNDSESYSKTIRKPEEIIPLILSSTKVSARKTLESIRAVSKPVKGRINKECLILRSIK